jgi:xanthosine utilization system XapX-like protein
MAIKKGLLVVLLFTLVSVGVLCAPAVLRATGLAGRAAGRSAAPLQTTVILTAVADATLKNGVSSGSNFGTDPLLGVSYNDGTGSEEVSLVRFNLSSIPPEATIESAVLGLYLYETTGLSQVTIGAYYVTSAWDETSVTWNTAPSWEALGLAWGLDNATGTYYERDIASWARAWQGGTNNGFALRGPHGAGQPIWGRWFDSRENLDAHPPRLVVTYCSDLVMEALAVAPPTAYAYDDVLLTAHVFNTGPHTFENVPVRFAAGGVPFDERVVGQILPGQSVPVTLTHVFSTTGALHLSATVNPDGALHEARLDNNAAYADLELIWEESPGWSRPDLALSEMAFTPHRPNSGQAVTVTARLANVTTNPAPPTLVVLRVDGVFVAEQPIGGTGPGGSWPITLTWGSAAPGRHLLTLEADPDRAVQERDESNNRLDEWVRVAGAPDPLPDLDVEQIALNPPAPQIGGSAVISVVVHNEGYGGAVNLPVLLTLDGYEITRTVIPVLPPDGSTVIAVPWNDVSEGEHVIAAHIDPDNWVLDDSPQAIVAVAVTVPGTAYLLPFTTASTRWQFIGPTTLNAYDGGVGRIDSIAISPLSSNHIVVGAPSGGVWRTRNGGQTWTPVGDYLPSHGAPAVAFDPITDSIVYATGGTRWWGSSDGIYKSLDDGGHWTTFMGDWIVDRPTKLILRYFTPGTLTILAATPSGVWRWQGDPLTTTTTQAQWERVWQQSIPGEGSDVSDMLITAESPPQLYIAVYGDSVYRITATIPISTAWTRLDSGLPADPASIKLGNSPISPSLIYASVKSVTGTLEIYRRNSSSANWAFRSRPSDTYGDRNTYNAFIGVHPSNANILYIGGVPAYRSSDGGLTFSYTVPYVHMDYKAVAFDPQNSSIVYFTSDGGVYKCTNDTGNMSCSNLNTGLDVTQFYDIALAATQISRTIGGTQDNGNNWSDGTLTWTQMSHGGDGKYTAIDPTAANTWFAQDQYADSTARTTDAGVHWTYVVTGLQITDVEYYDPFMLIHPTNGQILFMTLDQVYRTTNAGDLWLPIGPSLAGNECVNRIAVQTGTPDRYYISTCWGGIWTALNQSLPLSWTKVFTHPYNSSPSSLLIDPANSNVLYATFSGAGGAWRVVKLVHSGGWPGTWTATDVTGDLPSNRWLTGGPGGATRGLVKETSAEVLYVGTNRGVWAGWPVSNTWQWLPDTCGLPATAVSDLERHPSGNFVRAATYGRGVYQRGLPQPATGPDAYDVGARNDTLATAASVTDTWVSGFLTPGLTIEDLNLDRLNDVDYFAVQLPPGASGPSACLDPGDPILANPACSQCSMEITVHAPETPDPFELRLYRADGSVSRDYAARSNLTYEVYRPGDFFPTGAVTLSVRSPTGCRSQYDLYFSYHTWFCKIEIPPLLFDPPRTRRIVPELGDLTWMFPADPEVINLAFAGQIDALPEQRLIFHWDHTRDFVAAFQIEGAGGLNATLVNAANQPVASALAPGMLAATVPTSTMQIGVPNLPAGWYALDIGGGAFPTYFQVTFNELGRRIYLPVVLRNYH